MPHAKKRRLPSAAGPDDSGTLQLHENSKKARFGPCGLHSCVDGYSYVWL